MTVRRPAASHSYTCSHSRPDSAHTLPILFAFTTPAKYCFRAMATFIKYVTGMLNVPVVEDPIVPEAPITVSPASTQSNLLAKAEGPRQRETGSIASRMTVPLPDASTPGPSEAVPSKASSTPAAGGDAGSEGSTPTPNAQDRKSMRRALSASVSRATTSLLRRNHTTTAATSASSSAHGRHSTGSSDVGGPRFRPHEKDSSGNRNAKPVHQHTGEPSVYNNGLVSDSSPVGRLTSNASLMCGVLCLCARQDAMIRERISTHGIIRPLEPESELDAFRLPPELIGEISELAVRRYIDGTAKFGKKFAKTYKSIEKARQRNLERAHQDAVRNMAQLQQYFSGASPEGRSKPARERADKDKDKEDFAASSSWAWAWALDEDEHPPPSSIVSRRDTEEARRLAKVADQAVFMDENALSGNNLWSLIVDFLTITPDRDASKHKHKHKAGHTHGHDDDEGAEPDGHPKDTDGEAVVVEGKSEKDHSSGKPEGASRGEKIMSRFSRLMAEKKTSQGVAASKNEQ